MNCLFYVKSVEFDLVYGVFGIRTGDGPQGMTEFLLYENGWFWANIDDYEPFDENNIEGEIPK